MIAATNPPSISAAAHAITRNTNSIDREANGKQPVSAFGNAIIAAHEDMAAIQAQKLAAGKSKLSVNTTHRLEAISHHYVPYVQTRNAKYVLRTTVNGVPVIPPGMHGKQLEQFVDHKSMAIQQAHAKTLVFISMAMPKHILKKMFATAWKVKKLRASTVFVLRGWKASPTGLPLLLNQVVHLFISPRDQPNVEVNPTLFTGHHVYKVPVILHEAPNHHWGAMVGDGYGLLASIHRIDRGKGSLHKIYGRTWRIAEPNLVKTIDHRAKTYNWKAAEQQAADTRMALISQETAVHLPESRKPLLYLWDPAVRATRNISLPDGQVVAHVGQEVNPLAYYPGSLQQHFIVFNPSEPWQVQDAEGWVSTYAKTTLMATRLPDTNHAYKALVEAFHQRVYALSAQLAARLGLKASPSLISINGHDLEIQVPAIPRLAPPPVATPKTARPKG